jgi:hypothetical protein
MLRCYVISPQLFQGPGASGDDATDLLQIFLALRDRVTVAVPREDLMALQTNLIDKKRNGRIHEQIHTVIEQELADAGPGIIARPMGEHLSAPARARNLAAALGVRDILIGAHEQLPREFEGLAGKSTTVAAKDLETEGISKNLMTFVDEAQLECFLERLLWRAPSITIVDPYLGKKAAERRHQDASKAMRFILRCAIRAQKSRTTKATLTIVTDRRKLPRPERRPAGNQTQQEDYAKLAEEQLRNIASGPGGVFDSPNESHATNLDITIAFAEDFTIRGVVTSGRVWQIEHDTDDLAYAIDHLRKLVPTRKTRRGNEPIIRIADAETSRQVRNLARRGKTLSDMRPAR